MALNPTLALVPWPTIYAEVKTDRAKLAEAVGCSGPVAGRLGPVVAALVERYAVGAPEAVKSEAVIRAAGWLYSNRPGIRKVGVSNIDIEFKGGQSALRHSGAMALLSGFKIRRAGKI